MEHPDLEHPDVGRTDVEHLQMEQPDKEEMICAHGLKRTFKTRGKETEAVKGIDMDVFKGEIVGFLGPNGAGKSTTLKMLCTLLEPSGGTIKIAGVDLKEDPQQVKRRIGYISQSGSTSSAARAGDEIVWHAQLHGMTRTAASARGKELLEMLDLEGIWTKKCGELSGGQRRRLDIVMGLIHGPELVFMDEPTTGLDPHVRANLWDHIRKLRNELGTTIFLTTHYMDEADALADRVLIIDNRKIVARGTPAHLKASLRGDSLSLAMQNKTDVELAIRIAEANGAHALVVEANNLKFRVENGAVALAALVGDLGKHGVRATGIALTQTTLNDVFLGLTGWSLKD